MLESAKSFREEHSRVIDSADEFRAFFTPENEDKPEIHGGFAWAHYNGDPELEDKLQKELKVTVRCIPMTDDAEPGKCIFTGQPSRQRVVFGKSY